MNKKKIIIFGSIIIVILIIIIIIIKTLVSNSNSEADVTNVNVGKEVPNVNIKLESANARGSLVPINIDARTLTNAALGWTGSSIGTEWNENYACKDSSGNSICQIWSISLTNNCADTVSFNVGITSLENDNIDVVFMGESNTSVTDITSIKNKESGLIPNVTLAGGASSNTYYFMVVAKNASVAEGDYTGVVTAVGSNGGKMETEFK